MRCRRVSYTYYKLYKTNNWVLHTLIQSWKCGGSDYGSSGVLAGQPAEGVPASLFHLNVCVPIEVMYASVWRHNTFRVQVHSNLHTSILRLITAITLLHTRLCVCELWSLAPSLADRNWVFHYVNKRRLEPIRLCWFGVTFLVFVLENT